MLRPESNGAVFTHRFYRRALPQTIYGMILVNKIVEAVAKGVFLSSVGVFGGAAIGMSAFYQGKDRRKRRGRPGGNGQRLCNYLIALGIIETVGAVCDGLLLGKIDVLAG